MNAKTSRRFLLVAAPFVYAAPLCGGCIVGLQYKGVNNIVHHQILETFLFMSSKIKADTSLNISKIKEMKNFSSDAELARFLGVTPAVLSRWRTRNTYDIDKIVDAIPNISLSWLLTGEGEMLRGETNPGVEEMNNNQLLSTLYKRLRDEKLVSSQAHFGRLIGENHEGNLSEYIKGKKSLGKKIDEYILSLESKMPMLSSTWLRTGEGEMLRGEHNPGVSLPDVGRRTDVWVGTDNRVYWTEAVQVGHEEDLQRAQSEGVRLIPEYTEAFRGGNQGEADELQTIDTYWGIPNLEGEMIVPIHGNSMSPKFPAGCRVALKRYPFSPANPLGIQFGEVYAVAVRQGDGYPPLHFIKRLHRHPDKAKERTTYIARSINPDYDDFEVSISDICHLSAVVARIEVEPLFSF
jgi:bacteriophage CI repressor helix-turn-helix domain